MAIPRVTENSVNRQGYTGVRVRPADFASGGEAIARGAQQLGEGVQRAAEGYDKINEIYDTAAVKKADADDLKQIMEIRAKALSAEGFDAQTAIADARQQIDQIKRQRMSTLGNPRQQRMYADVFDQRSLQLEEQFTSHSVKQTLSAEKATAVARGETYTDLAVDTYGTEAFQSNLSTALSEVVTANRGAGSVAVGRQQAKVKSGVYSRVISTMIADPDSALDAQDALERHAADILPEDEERLRKQINPLVEDQALDAAVGLIFGTMGTTPDGKPDPLSPLPEEGADIVRPSGPYHPLGGTGRVSNTAAQHRARGSDNALDIAAPEGTAIYPPMSGKVLFSGPTEAGGNTVIIEHPNGYVTGYAHMRAPSALKEGDTVEANTVIGGVGNTGTKSKGNHLHFTVRQSRTGPKVDPETVNWSAAETTSPDKVDWSEGPLNLARPEKQSTANAIERLNKVAAEKGWSQRFYDKVLERVIGTGNRNEALQRKQADARMDQALETVLELDEGLTSRSQVPGFGLLDVRDRITIDNIIKRNKDALEGGAATEGGAGVLTALTVMYENPAGFANMTRSEVLALAPTMKPGEFKSVYTNWLRLNNDPNNDYAGRLTEASAAANKYLPKDMDRERRILFQDKYAEAVTSKQTSEKRELTPQEKDAIARSLTVEVVRYKIENGEKGESLGRGRLFEYKGIAQGEYAEVKDYPAVFQTIPQPLRDQIIVGLRARGQRHSVQDVVREYLKLGR